MRNIKWGVVSKTRHSLGVLSDVRGKGVRGKYAVDEYPKKVFSVIFWKNKGGDTGKEIAVASSLSEGKKYAKIFDAQ